MRRILGRALTGALLCAAPLSLHAQRAWFAPTLHWDTGLIDTPAAWVSPLSGDMTLHGTTYESQETGVSGNQYRYYKLSASVSMLGRAEFGTTALTARLRGGMFARALLWNQQDGAFRTGLIHWAPSVAIGVRNLAGFKVDRWARLDTALKTTESMYAVATRTWALGDVDEVGARAKTQVTVNAGFGTGLFSDDAGRGVAYAKHRSGGAFAGAKLDVATSRYSNLGLIAEWSGWDYNVGAVFDWSGLQVAAYLLEADAGSARAGVWTYAKPVISVGWQTNALALVRGNKMDQQVAKIEREREGLQKQIRQREQAVQTLNTQLKQVEGATEADRRAQRELIEQKLREEQEALKRLQELMKTRKPPQ